MELNIKSVLLFSFVAVLLIIAAHFTAMIYYRKVSLVLVLNRSYFRKATLKSNKYRLK
jgi:hypothetical protein